MRSHFDEIAASVDSIAEHAGSDYERFMRSEPLYREALTSRTFLEPLHRILSDNLRNSIEISPSVSFGNYIVLSQQKHTSWGLTHPVNQDSFYYMPHHFLEARVSVAEIMVRRLRIPDGINLEVFDPAASLEEIETFKPALDMPFAKNGNHEVLEVAPINGGDPLTLRVNTVLFGNYEWAFDRHSLRGTQIFTLREPESFAVTIFDFLRDVADQASLPVLEPFTKHTLHFVRWRAIQTICAIAPDVGRQYVERSADDQHPHIRAAARRTLELQSA